MNFNLIFEDLETYSKESNEIIEWLRSVNIIKSVNPEKITIN